MKNNKKDILILIFIGVIIVNLIFNFTYYNKNKKIYKAYEEEIDLLREELNESKEAINETNNNIENKNNDLNKALEEKERLQQKIDDMYNEVSFNSEDVSQSSGATVYQMKKALKSTSMSHLASSFIEAENKYGVNAYFLAGITALESGWATSNRANNGSNNLTGHAVYSDLSRGSTFDSQHECIMITARDLKKDYINTNGQWYKGKSVEDININYSTASNWSTDVISIANKLVSKSNS